MGLIFWILLFLRETSQFLRGKAPISIFARLRLQPQRRQIKSYSLHLLSHKSNLKIHHLHDAPFEASSEGQKNTKFCCGQNCLATKMKGSSLGCFRVLCAAWLTEKINKSYIDSALAWKYKLIIPSKHSGSYLEERVCFALILMAIMQQVVTPGPILSRQSKLCLHKICTPSPANWPKNKQVRVNWCLVLKQIFSTETSAPDFDQTNFCIYTI